MKHVMHDLETLGQSAGCSILSIGAIDFDPKDDTPPTAFYTAISRASCKEYGLFEDPGTLTWWDRQSMEAKQVLEEAGSSQALSLPAALTSFNEYLMARHPISQIRLWGNGADFDNAIMAASYRACGLKPAWKFYHNRCYRTAKSMMPSLKISRRRGIAHNAVADAMNQADHLMVLAAHIPQILE